jgi:hypothetical protein
VSIIYEASDSPRTKSAESGEGGSATVSYNVLETDTAATARALAKALAPLAVAVDLETLVRQEIDVQPTGYDCWRVDVSYGPESDSQSQETPEPGTWKFDFDTSGGRHKVTKSLATISRHWKSGTDEAPDLKGAIGYDGERVNGVEILIPVLKFTITAYYDPTDVTTELMRTLARATPRYNSDSFLGFDEGEVLYLGTSGSGDIPTVAGQRVAPIALKHSFEASENLEDIDPDFTLGDPQVPIDAKGWEYVWYRYKKDLDSADQPLLVPVHAYVEQLYKPLAFAAFFGFGASS